MERKTLTQELVQELGWNDVEHITADMLEGCTEIGDAAFYGCKKLASVIIPNSVTSIGYKAFAWCDGLVSVTIPNSVASIGINAFGGCRSLTSIEIPNGVTSIEDSVFEDCESLTSVIIPNGVTRIGDYAFSDCKSLTSVTIPNSVTTIGIGAFWGCSSLTSVIIPNSVTRIGCCAFEDCFGLTSVTIGDVEYKNQEVINGKCKAYKVFNRNMTCREFQYEEDKTYEVDGEIELCERGFHACLNLADVFNYYFGELGEGIHIHEVELEGVSKERRDDSKVVGYDSKVVASKITIGKRII